MPGFLHFWQGAVTIDQFYAMDYGDYLRMRAYQRQAEKQIEPHLRNLRG